MLLKKDRFWLLLNKTIFRVLGGIFLFITTSCNPKQEKNLDSTQMKIYLDSQDKKILSKAIEFGDIGVALQSTYSLMSRDTANLKYYDTLATLYYNSKSYKQAFMTSSKILKKEENNHKMLLIAGQSLKNAGQIPESMLYFLKLQENLPHTKSSYEQIFCKVYENDTKIILEGINSLLQRNQNSYLIVNQQRIPLQAVLFNLKGFVTIELNHQPQEGMTYYKKCLEIYPEYKGIKERIK
jgi:tetratricopeptide (TPR) repeat protein